MEGGAAVVSAMRPRDDRGGEIEVHDERLVCEAHETASFEPDRGRADSAIDDDERRSGRERRR